MCCQNNTYDLKNVSSVKQNFSKEKLFGGGGGGGGGGLNMRLLMRPLANFCHLRNTKEQSTVGTRRWQPCLKVPV